eukprot:790923-Pyramimonas_sp.AAC.2
MRGWGSWGRDRTSPSRRTCATFEAEEPALFRDARALERPQVLQTRLSIASDIPEAYNRPRSPLDLD